MEDKKTIDVTCAIIAFDQKILVVQRSEQMAHPLKWEFPGGKIALGETEEACIIREIREELDISIQVIRRLSPSIYTYPDLMVNLIPFLAKYASGVLTLREHKRYLYCDVHQLTSLDWAEADIPILIELLDIWKKEFTKN